MACCGTTTTTSSCNTCGNTCSRGRGNGFLLVIVLYILLAIIVGSFIC